MQREPRNGTRGFNLPSRLLTAGLFLLIPLVASGQTTTRVNLGPGGTQANAWSSSPSISADGRFVAFSSSAWNLVPGDTNNYEDVFVHDRQTGVTSRVSVATGGVQANGRSSGPALSGDGRYVAFGSEATNLVSAGSRGVFLHDRQTGETTRIATGFAGGAVISADGRRVGYSLSGYLLVHDRVTNTTVTVTRGLDGLPFALSLGGDLALSADGRWASFWYGNLSPPTTPPFPNPGLVVGGLYVRDLEMDVLTLVSVASDGSASSGMSPSLSADGRFIAFLSRDFDLVPGDVNGMPDIFVRDMHLGVTTRVTVGVGGSEPAGGVTGCMYPVISTDGRYVAYWADFTNIVPGDTNSLADMFLYDREAETTERVNLRSTGGQSLGSLNGNAALSANGRAVVFGAHASDLVPGDTNALPDIFVRDRGDSSCAATLSPSSAQAPSAGVSGTVAVSAPSGCAWTAVSSAPSWLSVTAGTSGTGNGSVSYAVAANTGAQRSAVLTIGSATFAVQQAAGNTQTPLAPQGLTAHAVNGNTVTLRWNVPAGGPAPTSFVVEGGLTPGSVLAGLPTGSTAPTFTFAAPPGSYYVRVHALNGAVRSSASNEILLHVTPTVAPSAPANLLGLVNHSSLALAWTNTHAGGTPTALVLEVTGSIAASLPLGFAEGFTFPNVPDGTYTLTLRAMNAGGASPPSNSVTLTFPSPCSGPPQVPSELHVHRSGQTVFVEWSPPMSGPAPTGYYLNVTGALVGSFPVAGRTLSGTVGPGAYTLSALAANPCGTSAATPPQTIVVP
jgi:hypothetical protein